MAAFNWEAKSMELKVPQGPAREVSVYLVNPGTTLYRGRTQGVRPSLHTPLWFTTKPEVAEIYGYTDVYNVKKPFLLLNFAERHTRDLSEAIFRAWASTESKNQAIFAASYPVADDGRVLRDSSFSEDNLIVQWFADAVSLGNHPFRVFAGFGTNTMPTGVQNEVHHPEIVLIDPDVFLQYHTTIQRDSEDKEDEYAYKRIQKLDALSRQKRSGSRQQPFAGGGRKLAF